MNKLLRSFPPLRVRTAALLLFVAAGLSWSLYAADGAAPEGQPPEAVATAVAATSGSCAVALSPHHGNDPLDRRIAAAQRRAGDGGAASLESLGWLYVAKARRSYDPGFYKLAEASADCALQADETRHDARLLRGHVLYSMHRFAEAKGIAEHLTAAREAPFDYGLLGDVALSQGHTADATAAYQKMVDLRPGLQSYSRAAQIRWLAGEVSSANELMRMAAAAGSGRDPESLAWAWSQVAGFEMQVGTSEAAFEAASLALATLPDHAPALLSRGRLHLLASDASAALDDFRRAAELNPLPEYQWALADALRAFGRDDEARVVEAALESRGPVNDPRTTALYASTRAVSRDGPAAADLAKLGLRLAERELDRRTDLYTRDAWAWALLAAGEPQRAREEMTGVLGQGTQDARLFLHAGIIAARAGDGAGAERWLQRARSIEHMLLPSEQELLSRYAGGPNGPVGEPAEPVGASAREERNS